ncbi:MAG: Rieske (2Fe-2S) protein [Actinomycetia bacterium]|nr:Rieske (2Fe-2S) protein [Actinomycetes bacterium]
MGGAVLAAAPALAACGSDEPAATDPSPTPSGSEPQGGDGGDGGNAEVLVATADVPEGGGVILDDPQVVVTQPTAGEFVAFSSICTHKSCPVADVADGTINCACHGSQFSVEDGSVVTGPATSPLPSVAVTVDGPSVVRA